jgi:hypothetical protein
LYLRAVQRRRLVLTKFFQWIDTVIPIIRLGLLLNFWRTVSSFEDDGSSKVSRRATTIPRCNVPNLAMLLSGLAYHAATTPKTGAVTTTTTSFSSEATTTAARHAGFFVLFAHRRWVHQEMIPLLWYMVVSPVLVSVSETYHMIRRFINDIATPSGYYYWILQRRRRSWSRRMSTSSIMNQSPTDNDNSSKRTANDSVCVCALCGISKMIVPYQIKDCEHVACYTCLWEFLRDQQQQQQQQRLPAKTRYGKDTVHSGTEEKLHCPVCWESIQLCCPL